MGYFLDSDKSITGIGLPNSHNHTINELAGAMDIDNLLLQHVIDYMQSENKVKFLSDSLYEKDFQTIYARAIVLTESVENYKAWVEKNKKSDGCLDDVGCLLLPAFIGLGLMFLIFVFYVLLFLGC